jgi:hypothetical protein
LVFNARILISLRTDGFLCWWHQLFLSDAFVNPEVPKWGILFFVYYIGTGLFLGYLMDRRNGACFRLHAANNLIGALVNHSDWSAFQTHSLFLRTSESRFRCRLPVL